LLTIMHTQGNLLGGFNKVALQFGKGSAASTGGFSLGANSNDKVTRLTEQIMIQPKGAWSGMGTFVYEDKETAGVSSKWTSIGARPVYHFTDNYSLAVELGHDIVKPEGREPQPDQADLRAATVGRQQLLVAPRAARLLHLRQMEQGSPVGRRGGIGPVVDGRIRRQDQWQLDGFPGGILVVKRDALD
jgi:hypothetical protein